MRELETLASIINTNYGVDRESLFSKCRKRELVEFRFMCAYILRTETKYTTTILAKPFKFNHTTITYYCKHHSDLYEHQSEYKEKFDIIYELYKHMQGSINRMDNLISRKQEIEREIEEVSARIIQSSFQDDNQKKEFFKKIKLEIENKEELSEFEELSILINNFNYKFNKNYSISGMYISKKDGMQKIVLTDDSTKSV